MKELIERIEGAASYLRREWGLFILPPMTLAVAAALRAIGDTHDD